MSCSLSLSLVQCSLILLDAHSKQCAASEAQPKCPWSWRKWVEFDKYMVTERVYEEAAQGTEFEAAADGAGCVLCKELHTLNGLPLLSLLSTSE